MTDDYKSHGMSALVAGLIAPEVTVIGRNVRRHRRAEFIKILNQVNCETPAGKNIHLMLDNYAVQKHPKVREWPDRHSRFTFNFLPNFCSWLNTLDGYFAKLGKRSPNPGVFRSLFELHAYINRFVVEYIQYTERFALTVDPESKHLSVEAPKPKFTL